MAAACTSCTGAAAQGSPPRACDVRRGVDIHREEVLAIDGAAPAAAAAVGRQRVAGRCIPAAGGCQRARCQPRPLLRLQRGIGALLRPLCGWGRLGDRGGGQGRRAGSYTQLLCWQQVCRCRGAIRHGRVGKQCRTLVVQAKLALASRNGAQWPSRCPRLTALPRCTPVPGPAAAVSPRVPSPPLPSCPRPPASNQRCHMAWWCHGMVVQVAAS